MKRKKLRDQIVFGLFDLQTNLVTKQFKIANSFTYKYVVIPHTKEGLRNLGEKCFGREFERETN
jgi:hypothetical protein